MSQKEAPAMKTTFSPLILQKEKKGGQLPEGTLDVYYRNKAVYTTTPVAGGWAVGRILDELIRSFVAA